VPCIGKKTRANEKNNLKKILNKSKKEKKKQPKEN
jgi:hypothetical protein